MSLFLDILREVLSLSVTRGIDTTSETNPRQRYGQEHHPATQKEKVGFKLRQTSIFLHPIRIIGFDMAWIYLNLSFCRASR